MDLLGILRIKDSNGNWVSVPGLKGDTGEPFKILGIYATAAALEAAVTDPGVGDVYLVGTTGAYDIYLYLADGWHNTGRYMPKGDTGPAASDAQITSAVSTWLGNNVDPTTGYVLDRTLAQANAAAPADMVGDLKESFGDAVDVKYNYFNEADALSGYYYDGMTIGEEISANANSDYCGIIFPVKAGNTYVVQRSDWRWEELDENNKVLAYHGSTITQNYMAITPNTNGVKKVAISWWKNSIPISEFMILPPETSFSEYIPYPYEAKLTDKTVEDTGLLKNSDLDIEKIENITDAFIVKDNFFNPATAVTGKYVSGDVGSSLREGENATYAYNVIAVEYGTNYIVSQSNYAWFEFDANMICLTRLGSQTERTDFEYTPTRQDVKYVAFSWLFSSSPINQYMVTKQGVSRAKYIDYPSVSSFSPEIMENSGIETENVYTVGAGKDYESFTACLAALRNNTSQKTIYVYSGEYDIFEELGGNAHMQEVDVSQGWRGAQEIVPQNTKIVGVGDVLLKFNPSDADIIDYEHGWLMSPLNISGSCEIENISVEGSNCRYAIHIEATGAQDDANTATIVLKNVRAKRTSTSLMGVHQVIGTGIGVNAKWKLENCTIIGGAGSPGFSVHTNAPNSQASATVELLNCVFDTLNSQPTTNPLVQFITQYLPVAITNYAFVNSCFVRGKIGTSTTSQTYRQSYKVSVVGGTSYGLIDATTSGGGYTIENYGNDIKQI